MTFYPERAACFVLVSTDHGTMIVNRNDYSVEANGGIIGVGVELFGRSHYDEEQLDLLCKVIEMRRESFGDGVTVIDGGANIGCYSLEIGRLMTGWGSVLAFEPQKWPFMQLCGNVCIGNLFNVEVLRVALGKTNGVAPIKCTDPRKPMNFGGLSLHDTSGPLDEVALATIDGFGLPRLDVLKLDVEGMEIDALEGAEHTLRRCKPIICAEHIICGLEVLEKTLGRLGYQCRMTGMNVLAIHEDDPVRERIRWFDAKEEAA